MKYYYKELDDIIIGGDLLLVYVRNVGYYM